MLEAHIKETELICRLVEFLREVLPQSTPLTTAQHHTKIETLDIAETPKRSAISKQTELPSMGEMSASYEDPKRRLSSSGDFGTTDDDDDVRGFYEIASPSLNNMRFLHEQYSIRRDDNTLMIGNSDIIADENRDIKIRRKRFRGTNGLWEILTRKNINMYVVTTSDLKQYKHILEMTNAHLVGYELGSKL